MSRRLVYTRSFLFISLAALGGAGPAGGQSLSYSRLEAVTPSPSGRLDGAIIYNPGNRSLYLFGGRDSSPQNDLWAFSIENRRWQELIVSGEKPPARFGHTLILDPLRRRLVVFGGQAGGFFSDVWAFDLILGRWQLLSPDDAGPNRRYAHSAIYDAQRDRMVISHGFTDEGRFDDTWSFDLARNSWTNVSPQGARPLRRCLHHAAHDFANDRMLLYGGCASGFGPCPLGDLWSFDLSANRWTEITGSTKPPPRQWYGLAFDAARDRLVIFGGSGGGLLNDTWEFNTIGNTWSQPVLNGEPPSPRERHETAYAMDMGLIFFFGGSTAAGLTNEIWVLSANERRPRLFSGGIGNAFSGQSGSAAPGEIVSLYGTNLGPVDGVATSFDQATGRLPVAAAGVSITMNGIPAPLYFVRSDQVNVQAPYELAGASQVEVVVHYNGVPSPAEPLATVPAKPGLFPRAWNEDASLNSADNAASRGSIIVMFATGQGVTNPPSPSGGFPTDVYPIPSAPVAFRIGGVEAELIFYSQAPFTAGVMQINARVPAGVTPGDAVPVELQIGDSRSQPGVAIAVR